MKRVLSRRDLAALLAVEPQTIAKWHCLRRGPRSFRRGHRVFYSLDDVRDWLEDPVAHEAAHHAQRDTASTKT